MGDGRAPAALEMGKVALQQETEEALEFGDAGQQIVLATMIEQEQLAVFQRFDTHIRWRLVVKALGIADPPAFDGKAEIGLAAVLIDIIAPYATLYDKRFEIADIALLQKEGPLL